MLCLYARLVYVFWCILNICFTYCFFYLCHFMSLSTNGDTLFVNAGDLNIPGGKRRAGGEEGGGGGGGRGGHG